MDIVSRLKQYLEAHQISVTQFADTCGIPRPSASQLLNGRNKKVSDEVITKIHQSYPSLSMLWLLFGEGSMESGANIETSEAQIGENSDIFQGQQSDNVVNDLEFSFASHTSAGESEKNSDYGHGSTLREEQQSPYYPSAGTQADKTEKGVKAGEQKQAPKTDSFTFTTDTRKRVMSIVVYYDDNSFESFIPDPTRRTPFSR